MCTFPLKSYSRRRKGHYTKKGELSWFLGREVRIAELSGKPFLGREVFMQEPSSKVKVKFAQKCIEKQRTGHISEAISLTDFIFGTKVQSNKAHSMTQVPMTLTFGQGQRSRSNFPKNG